MRELPDLATSPQALLPSGPDDSRQQRPNDDGRAVAPGAAGDGKRAMAQAGPTTA